MIVLTIAVAAPPETAQAVKEHLAMTLEAWGDTRVIAVTTRPDQIRIGGIGA